MKVFMFRDQRSWSIVAVIGFGLLSAQIVASTAHGRSEGTPSPNLSFTELDESVGVEATAELTAHDTFNVSDEQTTLDFTAEDQLLVGELPSDRSDDLGHDPDVASDERLALAAQCCIQPGGVCTFGKCGPGGTPVPCPCYD